MHFGLRTASLAVALVALSAKAVVVDVAMEMQQAGGSLLVGNVSEGGIPLLTIRQPITVRANASTLSTGDGTLVLLGQRRGAPAAFHGDGCDALVNATYNFGRDNATAVIAVDLVACPAASASDCGHCPATVTARMLSTITTASTAHGTADVLVNVPAFATAAAADTRMSIWHGLWPVRYECDLPSSDPLACFGSIRPARHDGPVAFTSADAAVFVGPVSDPLNTLYTLGPGSSSSSSSDEHRDAVAGGGHPQLVSFGPSSSLAELPKGYGTTVGIVAGRGHFGNRPSLRDLAVAFGKLQREHWFNNGSDVERLQDALVTRLSYWTGNGDFYYYDRQGHAVLPADAGATLARVVATVNRDIEAFNALHNLSSSSSPSPSTTASGAAGGLAVVDSLQLDGWWSNSSSMFPEDSLFPLSSYAAMRNTTRGILLYKCLFGKHFPLYGTYPMAPGNGGYPEPRVAEEFFAAVFALGQTSYLGMTAYEMDFMSNRILDDPGLNRDVSNGLLQFHEGLAAGALARRMPTLFCMPSAGQALFAALAPAVTHVRVSVDYEEQDVRATGWPPTYLVGGPGVLIAASPTLRAFKDSTWTSAEQPGCPYPTACTKPTVAMDVTLAALSTGPVGIGDKLGATNVTLLATAISTVSGRILQPSAPLASVTRSAGPAERLRRPSPLSECPDAHTNTVSRRCEPEVATTYACAADDEAACAAAAAAGRPISAATHVVYHVFAVQLGSPFTLQIALGDLFPHPPLDVGTGGRRSYLRRQGGAHGSFAAATKCRHGVDAVASGCVEPYNWTHDVPDLSTGPRYRDEATGAPAWGHFTIFSAAGGSGGWTFLGEATTKAVPVAAARFAHVACSVGAGGCQYRFVPLEPADGAAAPFEAVTVGAIGPSGTYCQSRHVYRDCVAGSCTVSGRAC